MLKFKDNIKVYLNANQNDMRKSINYSEIFAQKELIQSSLNEVVAPVEPKDEAEFIDLLYKGDIAQQNDNPEEAERYYANVVCFANNQENYKQMLVGLHKIAEQYIGIASDPKQNLELSKRQFLLIKSTALYNFAINIGKSKLSQIYYPGSAELQQLTGKLAEIEQIFLRITGISNNLYPYVKANPGISNV